MLHAPRALATLTCLLAPAALAGATSEFRLDNGLELIVHEDHRASVAVVQVWYRVGSSYEHDGVTGVSHALEHMMFKGTQKVGLGRFSRIVAENGGEENAFTSADYTAYYQQWGADKVGLSFELEADRMRGLLLDKEEFGREMRVVMEERRLRTEDDPQALAQETTLATAFQTSPYRHPVIGWAADIEHMSVEDLRAWYERWYAPNNAIVVVVGDVDPKQVLALAQRHFGPLPARAIAPDKPRPEVPQRGLKRVVIEDLDARLPLLMMSYKVPVLPMALAQEVPEWEVYALEVLAATLDGGASARLSKELVRGREVAVQASASYSLAARLQSLFSFSAVPRPGVTLEQLEDLIEEQIARLQNEPPSDEELSSIKTQVVADALYERDSLFYQAMLIGSLESIGLDWRLKDDYVGRVKAVTAEQVQAVARKYLINERATITYLVPAAEAS
jgi:zinc protease